MPPRVLLAQPSKFDRAEVELALQSLGWEVTATTSAKQALELAKESSFEFILIALTMEDGDGMEVSREIRAHEGATRKALIVATTKSGAVQEEVCIQAGMDGIINFDCEQDELRAQLQKWLAKLAFKMWKTEGLPRITLNRIWTSNNK